MLSEIFQTVYRLQLTLPTRWVMLDKTLATLAGVALQLSPEFNVFESARPYARRSWPSASARIESGRACASGPRARCPCRSRLPDAGRRAAQRVDRRRLRRSAIHVDDLPQSAERIERATNRLVLALLAFGLLVSSSIIGALLHTGVDGRWVRAAGDRARILRFLPDCVADRGHLTFGEVVVAWTVRRVPYATVAHPS